MSHLIELRKTLHRFPEVSGNETETAKRILAFLKPYAPSQIISPIGHKGIAAIYNGKTSGPTVLIRCELDALPIQEINSFEHKSTINGVSHKCGHDGHMSILAGLATHFHKNKPAKGRVVLLFQPAEENGEGAASVLADPQFKTIEPDFVFALHNLPGYKMHQIVCKENSFTASVKSINFKLDGKTAHAGEPEKGINPSLAIAEIMQGVLKMQEPIEQDTFAQVTPIQISMGEEAYGISAGHAVMRFTIRTWNKAAMEKLDSGMVALAEQTALKYGLKLTVEYTQFFASNLNNPAMVKLVKNAASQNGLAYFTPTYPNRWGEDFGLFTEKYTGCMFGLGAGENTPALHNPDYDFPDEIAPTGINMFLSIVNQILN